MKIKNKVLPNQILDYRQRKPRENIETHFH